MLSGVPVSQVQEDLVRHGGFKHRKLAQMACRRVPDAPPPPTSGRMLERPNNPSTFAPFPSIANGDRDVVDVTPLLRPVTMKSKPSCPSVGCLASAQPCVGVTEEVRRTSLRLSDRQTDRLKGAGGGEAWPKGRLTPHPESRSAPWPAWPLWPSPDIWGYFSASFSLGSLPGCVSLT